MHRIRWKHTWMCKPSFSITSRYWGRAWTIFCISLVDISCPPLLAAKQFIRTKVHLPNYNWPSKNNWKARLLSVSSQIANHTVIMDMPTHVIAVGWCWRLKVDVKAICLLCFQEGGLNLEHTQGKSIRRFTILSPQANLSCFVFGSKFLHFSS